MSSIQKKILGIVQAQIAEHGLEAIVKGQWANTGTILIEKPGAFGSVAKVSYNFQDDRFTLSIYRCAGERDVGVPSQPPRQGYFDHYLSYSDRAGFETFQRILKETLNAVAPKTQDRVILPGRGKYMLQFTEDCSPDYRNGFLAAVSFFDGSDGFQMVGSSDSQVPEWVMVELPNQDNETYSVRGDGSVEFESTGVVI